MGGGAVTFETVCLFPACCERCRRVVVINLMEEQPACPECGSAQVVPYDDPRLSRAPGQEVVARWRGPERLDRNLVLTDGQYRCPGCGQLSLRFRNAGMSWD